MLCASTVAQAERRVAFVAGVNAYANLPPEMQLQRAVADASTVADTLQSLGFSVTRMTSGVTLTGFLNAFGAFTRGIEPGDTAVFYFAGHGISIDNQNFLIPSDIPALAAGGESVVKKLALAETDLIEEIKGRGARVAILVIDACRDNPFPKSGTRSLGGRRGLSAKEPPDGVFSLYSAGAGQQALDRLSGNDPSPNSVFTRVFVAELKKPGVNLLDLGETVREEVALLARRENHSQVPAVYNQVLGARRILLAGAAPAPAAETAIAAPPTAGVGGAANSRFADLVSSLTDRAALLRFAEDADPAVREAAKRRLAALPAPEADPRPPAPRTTPVNAAALVEACDRLAASDMDADKPAHIKGVAAPRIVTQKAIPACEAALEAAPRERRVAFQLGRSLDIGKDHKRAAITYEKAAALGSAAAMSNLGALYVNGTGVAADPTTARLWYEKGADLGNSAAMTNLGFLHEQGIGVPVDLAAAHAWFQKAAALGNPIAMTSLAWQYAKGKGVPADPRLAATWFGRAADLGDPDAMNSLGVAYFEGNGVPQDFATARRLYEKAAELGVGASMFNLGTIHEFGKGVPADDAIAQAWYERAAALGNARAGEAVQRLAARAKTRRN